MLAFFRRIRKSLIANGNAQKYLFYALGEIILVVIGILIAINFNNSNQNKISTNERYDKLNKLRELVYSDSLGLVYTINYNRDNMFKIDSLIANLKPDMSLNEYRFFANTFAKSNMQYRTTLPDLSVYNELLNSGEFSNIEDTELKEKIANYYVIFNHFNDLNSKFVDALFITEKRLYYDGLLSHKYFKYNILEEDVINGYPEFIYTMKDPIKRRIFENHLYELKDMHSQIIFFYETILNQYVSGLPLKP
ncbi:MAG: DUF6090 family protein [Flavobacteriaceae bacterium]